MEAIRDNWNACEPQSPVSMAGVDDGFHVDEYISANDPVFAGHFPHLPIYPGVLLLHLMQRAVQRHAERHLGMRVILREVTRVSFQNPVFPDTRITLIGTCKLLPSSHLQARIRVESTHPVATARLDFKVADRAN